VIVSVLEDEDEAVEESRYEVESLKNVRYVSDDFDDRVEESEERFLEDCEHEVNVVELELAMCEAVLEAVEGVDVKAAVAPNKDCTEDDSAGGTEEDFTACTAAFVVDEPSTTGDGYVDVVSGMRSETIFPWESTSICWT